MPGVDAALVVGPVDEELLCAICTDVLLEPRCCRAGHVFCLGCISEWLDKAPTCPIGREALAMAELAHVRPLARMVDRLPLRCPHHGEGCRWVGGVATVQEHQDGECDYQPVPCTVPGCGATVQRRHLERHERTHAPPSEPRLARLARRCCAERRQEQLLRASGAAFALAALALLLVVFVGAWFWWLPPPAPRAPAPAPVPRAAVHLPDGTRLLPDGTRVRPHTLLRHPRGDPGPPPDMTPQGIVAAMRAPAAQADVVEDGCLALWSLAYKNGATSEEIVQAGGIEAIVEGMMHEPNTAAVQELCTAALWNLAIDGWWLEENPNPPSPPSECAPPTQRRVSASESIVSAGGIEAVARAMQLHGNNLGVVEAGCGALHFLSDDPDHWARLATSGGVDALLTALENFQESAAILEASMGALWQLAIDDSARELIADRGAKRLAQVAAQRFPNEPKLQQNAAGLQQLLALVELDDGALDPPVRLHAAEPLVAVAQAAEEPLAPPPPRSP